MRGFFVGSLALIALYTVLKRADVVETGGNALVVGMNRILRPGYAGIGNHAKKSKTTNSGSSTTTPPTGGVWV